MGRLVGIRTRDGKLYPAEDVDLIYENEPTGGGDAHGPLRPPSQAESAHVTGPAGAIPPTPAGPPDLQQAIDAAITAVRQVGEAAPDQIISLKVAVTAAVEAAWHLLVEQAAGLQAQIERLEKFRQAAHDAWANQDWQAFVGAHMQLRVDQAIAAALDPAAAPQRDGGDG